ncbi:MAG: AAA family ATPase [Phycisphaerae bacterium]
MTGALSKLSVSGFKSIRELKDFELGSLNIVIGANGAGKSNLIQLFRMLGAMAQLGLSTFVYERGGADSFCFNGPKETPKITAELEFESCSEFAIGFNYYRFELRPTVDERFLINEYRKYLAGGTWHSYGPPSFESRLIEQMYEKASLGTGYGIGHFVYETIANWTVYHFHDTSSNAPMKRMGAIYDNFKLRGDASNIAPLLLRLKQDSPESYRDILNAVRLVTPFFEDFRLDVREMGEEKKVALSWKQKGSDFPMQAYHLSDGTIRFICLATALLQPYPPSTIIIDEPELGLHPAAIYMLAELIQATAKKTQVIVATQSPTLIDQFAIEDIVVASRKNGASCFERLKESNYTQWLEDYTVGELWAKNVIEGGPVCE